MKRALKVAYMTILFLGYTIGMLWVIGLYIDDQEMKRREAKELIEIIEPNEVKDDTQQVHTD